MKIIFLGSPEIAVPSLKALIDSGEQVVGVVTQPDKPAGRGRELHACAIAQCARGKGLPLLQPERVRDPAFLNELKGLSPDLIVVVAYGKILPKEVLELPTQKCINVHFSLLPKYRGAAPVQWALINGDEATGVTTLFLTEKLDAGPILLQRKLPIEPEDTAGTLGTRLANTGAELLIETVERLKQNDLPAVPQNEAEATLAPSLKKEDGRLDFSKKAKALWNQLRGMTPWPGGFTTLGGKSLKVWHATVLARHGKRPGEVVALHPDGIEVACGDGALLLTEIQLEGKKRMPASEFLKGHPLRTDTILGR